MVEIDGAFLKTWREKYRWPFCKSRTASEEKILWLEKLVKENILKGGPWTVKDVFLEIVDWKTSGRQVQTFCRNSLQKIYRKIADVLQKMKKDSDDVSSFIRTFALKDKLEGVRIPMASAFLRFLDPINHSYGIIDKNIARFLNEKGITSFEFGNSSLANTDENILEYEKFHYWLKQKTGHMKNSTFTGIYSSQTQWSPVDVEMALFAYCTRSIARSFEIRKTGSEIAAKCPRCGSSLVWRIARRTGERYRGCTNYPECKYN